MRAWTPGLVAAALVAFAAPSGPADSPSGPAADLAGTWAGTLAHEGQTQPVALTLAPAADSTVAMQLSLPVIHLDHVPIGSARPQMFGDSVRIVPCVCRSAR